MRRVTASTSPSHRLRWGMWGAGAIAHAVADDLARVTGNVITRVGSRTVARAEALGRRVGATATTRFEDLLEAPDVDVVYISTPPERHLNDCLAAIGAGKAVLCEKPLATTAADAERIAAAASSAGVFVMEAMWSRFVPEIVAAHAGLSSGRIGRPLLFSANFAYPMRPAETPAVGVILDRGVYTISLATHLLGEVVDARCVADSRDTPDHARDHVAFVLEHANGALSTCWASTRVRGTNDAWIVGDRGRLHLAEPFYAPSRATWVDLVPPTLAPTDTSTDTRAPTSRTDAVVERIRRSPTLRAVRRVVPVDRLRDRGRTSRHPFTGSGYQFEVAEVQRCLADGLLESPTMPLQDSVAVLHVVDRLRTDERGRR